MQSLPGQRVAQPLPSQTQTGSPNGSSSQPTSAGKRTAPTVDYSAYERAKMAAVSGIPPSNQPQQGSISSDRDLSDGSIKKLPLKATGKSAAKYTCFRSIIVGKSAAAF
ncbi:hypothetical protein BASA83_011158 [Batrachochytrium salamandrivorans]|nr:hypothetical protein BASA83_011158 [Batrachochytrium salamandrivorans]